MTDQIRKYVQENDLDSLKEVIAQTPFNYDNEEECQKWGELLTECQTEECLSLLDSHAGKYYKEWGWQDIIWSGINPQQMNTFIAYIRDKEYLTPKQWGEMLRAMIDSPDQVQTANLQLVTSYVKEDTKKRRAHNKAVSEAIETLSEHTSQYK